MGIPRRMVLIPLAFLLAGGPAWAQGGPARIEVVVPDAACRQLVAHTPDSDVAFTPGRDVAGRPVVPADLNPLPPGAAPDTFTIALDIDVARDFGIPAPPFSDGTVGAGTVTVRDNQVFLNGRPLVDPLAATLAALCRRPR